MLAAGPSCSSNTALHHVMPSRMGCQAVQGNVLVLLRYSRQSTCVLSCPRLGVAASTKLSLCSGCPFVAMKDVYRLRLKLLFGFPLSLRHAAMRGVAVRVW